MERAAKSEEDVTNLGMKIVGEELEVGFTVSSREEFDAAVARLQTVAATIWASGAQQSGENQPLPPSRNLVVGEGTIRPAMPGDYATERKAAASWRDDQGLR